jgi:glutamate-1-semialdehyde 2,1-aminomutase
VTDLAGGRTAALAAARATYEQRTPGSAALAVEARRWLPGGDSRATLHHEPYPLFLERAEADRVTDVDGNEYVDLTGNHSALVHGNLAAPVVGAVLDQLGRGTCFPAPTRAQVDLARELVGRVPSLDAVRFTNSGTEATMHATRGARAATGRHRIAKVEGGYHGSQDDVFVSIHPTTGEAGPRERPATTPKSRGLRRGALDDTLVLPFNRPAEAADLIGAAGPELAAVLVEPVMGSAGMLAADDDYLRALREATAAAGALLIVDEVITFRLAPGGAQELADIRPDLTCYGKMIGGGLPLGAFGGRSDLMGLFDPTGDGPEVVHSGSLNANPLSLAAGLAAVRALTPEAITALNRRGDRLRAGWTRAGVETGVPLAVTGRGSLLGLHFTAGPIRDIRDTWGEDRSLGHAVFLSMMNEGFLIDPRGVSCLSTATTDDDVDEAVEALARILTRLADA